MYSLLGVDANKEVPQPLASRHMHLAFPLGLVFGKDVHLSQRTLRSLRLCASQFVILRPLLSILLLACDFFGCLAYVALPINVALYVSITFAVCALMSFYHTFDKELKPHRPLAKFLCIKGVVFFASAQATALRVLVHYGVIHDSHWYTTAEKSDAIQNLLVCIEMGALFSFAHNYAFDPAPYAKLLKDPSSIVGAAGTPSGDKKTD
jgi:hypothetical protein